MDELDRELEVLVNPAPGAWVPGDATKRGLTWLLEQLEREFGTGVQDDKKRGA